MERTLRDIDEVIRITGRRIVLPCDAEGTAVS
jgi:hypothetical protein